MSTTYYVKAYYTKQAGNQPEIRRFTVDISPENDVYHELCTKIATYQPDIQLAGFILQYVDEENERITFSSTEELRSAIATNKDGVALKIFVTPNQPSAPQGQQQQQDNNKECHIGVECDGCGGPVVGTRHKCFICPNYDLCEKCSEAGVHSEHNMIKITKPGNHFHPYGNRHRGGSGRRHRHMQPPFIPNPEFMERLQSQLPQWIPNGQNSEQFRTHLQHHFDALKTHGHTQLHNSKQYLESVGQYLQQALSPFGIDCDFHVDERTPNQEINTNEQQPPVNEEVPREEEMPAAAAATATAAAPEPETEPSAVPKYPDISDANQQQQTASASSNNKEQPGTISSLLNILRANGTTSSTSVTSSAASSMCDISNPTDKAVEECVEKMKAMGFNENNALIELIRSKQGDINLVLDAINPRHQ